MINDKKSLHRMCDYYGVDLTSSQSDKLFAFAELLCLWGKKHNLIATPERQVVLNRHIFDCCLVARYLPSGYLIDIGCGAGLPVIVLAILREDCQCIGIDARRKRTVFCQQAALSLDLKLRIINTRAEKLDSSDIAGSTTISTLISKAVSDPNTVMHMAAKLLASTTKCFFMRSSPWNSGENYFISAPSWLGPRVLTVLPNTL